MGGAHWIMRGNHVAQRRPWTMMRRLGGMALRWCLMWGLLWGLLCPQGPWGDPVLAG